MCEIKREVNELSHKKCLLLCDNGEVAGLARVSRRHVEFVSLDERPGKSHERKLIIVSGARNTGATTRMGQDSPRPAIENINIDATT